jgi:cell division protein FtsL
MKSKHTNLFVIILAILMVVTIFTAIKASGKGTDLVALEREASILREKNQELKDSIVTYSSLSEVKKIAEVNGMIHPERFVYMTNQGIAMR